MEARIRTGIWVGAHIRRVASQGVPALVVRHGDDDAGVVLIKINTLQPGGCMVLGLMQDAEGRRAWRRATGATPVEESVADDYIARQIKYDPDLWVVEIEDRQGRHFLDEPLVD